MCQLLGSSETTFASWDGRVGGGANPCGDEHEDRKTSEVIRSSDVRGNRYPKNL
jgi:hypothetical protein